MSDDIWSKKFYKALEAVSKLNEQEKLRLGEMLVSLSGVKKKFDFSDIPPPTKPPENRKAGMF